VRGNHFSIVLSNVCVLDAGLTIYEAAGGGPVPKNGEQWHAIRQGVLPELQQCSQDLNKLVKVRQEACAGYRSTAIYNGGNSSSYE
jgi:wee1-like protein kinase